MNSQQINVLRSLDKADRLPPLEIYALLTFGRKDQSGDFTPGCGLSPAQAAVLVGFVFARTEPQIARRLAMIEKLDGMTIDAGGKTAWDAVMEVPDVGAALDRMIEAHG